MDAFAYTQYIQRMVNFVKIKILVNFMKFTVINFQFI